jgi:hypothetical protein
LECDSTQSPPFWRLYRPTIRCPGASYDNWDGYPVSATCDPLQLIFDSSCDQCCSEPDVDCGLIHTVTL